LRALCQELSSIGKEHEILIVPGGGGFADVVREFDRKFELSDLIADKMAILAMDQFGLFLANITPKSDVCYTLREAKSLSRANSTPIFLPSRLLFREEPLEHSWDVTSDSVAAYIAGQVNADKLILLKDVDGIFTDDPKTSSRAILIESISAGRLLRCEKKTCVDKFLPKILLRIRADSYVANGKYPERTRNLIEGKSTTATNIKGN